MKRSATKARTPSKLKALVTSTAMSPTEKRNPASMKLDQMSVEAAISLMLSEEASVPAKLLREKANISRLVKIIAAAFERGGRLFYIGAGTSGRLGVLDASECPPTFRSPPGQVQGIIAGGDTALRQSVEGAEDDARGGQAAINSHRVNSKDVVVGIAASGTTPYVWGAIVAAKKRRAITALMCFNPHLRIPAKLRPTVVIAPDLGPEVLTGSTRLKAGTATKLLLNILTTISMARTGKVMSNLMVDLRPVNDKLRRRAVGIVRDLTGKNAVQAQAALEGSNWHVRKAVERLRKQ